MIIQVGQEQSKETSEVNIVLSVWEQRDSSSSDTGGCCFSLAVLGAQVCLFSEVCNTYCTLKIFGIFNAYTD